MSESIIVTGEARVSRRSDGNLEYHVRGIEELNDYRGKEVHIGLRGSFEGMYEDLKTTIHKTEPSFTVSVHKLRELNVSEGDVIHYTVKELNPPEQTSLEDNNASNDPQRVAVKPGSKVYHYADSNGKAYCNHTKGTKPGVESQGFLVADLQQVDDDWRVCNVCDGLESASDLTTSAWVDVVRRALDIERDSNTFNKNELKKIATKVTDADELEQLVKEVQE